MAREDIRLDIGFLNTLKTRKLLRDLGDHAVVCTIRLWSYVADRHPKGVLNGVAEDDLEEIAGWTGERGAYASYAMRMRWVDRSETGILSIHDWAEHQPYIFHSDKRSEAAKVASAARWEKFTKRGVNARRKRGVSGSDAEGNAPAPNPSPAPDPDPNPKEKKSVDLSLPVSKVTAAKTAGGALLDAAPPPAAASGVNPKIRAIGLTKEKEEKITALFTRYQAAPSHNNDLADDLLRAGLDSNEILKTAQIFLGAVGKSI